MGDECKEICDVRNIIFGCAPLGFFDIYGYDNVPDKEIMEAIDCAIKSGIHMFDTAPFYGEGLSENRLGEYLPKTNEIKIMTKVCHLPKGEKIYNSESMNAEFEQSLKRLRANFVETIRLHDCDDEICFQKAVEENSVETMKKIRANGGCEKLSLGLDVPLYIEKFIELYPDTFDNVLSAGSWNLINQEGYQMLLTCKEKRIEVVNAGIFGGGALWGGSNYRYRKMEEEVEIKIEKWKKLAEESGFKIEEIAFQFAMLPNIVKNLCIGFKNKREVQASVSLCKSKKVPFSFWERAQKLGLIEKHIALSKL